MLRAFSIEGARNLGSGTARQKREHERAMSYGAGRAILMPKVLDSRIPLALVSTTTQSAGQGVAWLLFHIYKTILKVPGAAY